MTSLSVKNCHTGTITVFKDPKSGILVKGGGATRELIVNYNDVLIDCGADYQTPLRINGFTPSIDLIEKYKMKSIRILWKDMDPPNLPKEFWTDLVKVIRAEKKDVIVACQGGHGRTGTALSILAGLMSNNGNPVKFVREHYCKEAVETSEQIEYIEMVCNIKLDDVHPTLYTTFSYKKKGEKSDTKWPLTEVTKKLTNKLTNKELLEEGYHYDPDTGDYIYRKGGHTRKI